MDGWNGCGKCDVTFSKHGVVHSSARARPHMRRSSAWENTTSTTAGMIGMGRGFLALKHESKILGQYVVSP